MRRARDLARRVSRLLRAPREERDARSCERQLRARRARRAASAHDDDARPRERNALREQLRDRAPVQRLRLEARAVAPQRVHDA